MIPLVLASIPRSGSTYLLRSICGLQEGPYTPPHVASTFGITKVHRPWPDVELPENARALFLFGDVVDCVVSTRLNRFEANHFANCGADWPPAEDLYDADVLHYEALWDSWTSDPPIPTLALRYEQLGCAECRSAISSFIGRPIWWLPWRARMHYKLQPNERSRIRKTYASLIAKVSAAGERWEVEAA